MTLQKTILPTVLALLLLCAPAWSSQTTLRDRTSDLWLESKLFTTYSLNEHLNPFEIDVDVMDGVAVLSGSVDTVIDKMLAVEIARGTEGIKAVKDMIKVGPPAGRNDPYGFMAHVTNASTVARVRYNLMWNKKIHSPDIIVASSEGRIVLSGTVASERQKKLAVDTAWNTSGVKYVVDNLAVDENAASASDTSSLDTASEKMDQALETTGKAFSDGWITARVKLRLLFDKKTDGLDIDVTADNGVVTLKGTVADKKEKTYTLGLVESLEQVKRVNDQLEIAASDS